MENQQPVHKMVLSQSYPEDDSDEFLCLICGRHLRIKWFPYTKTVLVEGDDTVIHSGGKGGLEIVSAKVLNQEEDLTRREGEVGKLLTKSGLGLHWD